jgi:hypothetical protein
MSAVLAAVFSDHARAERVRTRLVMDGFPTDRVELTSRRELGQARVEPAHQVDEKLRQYFGQLFQGGDDARVAEHLQRAVVAGHAVVAVHPRGDIETRRAEEILEDGEPIEWRATGLGDQGMERAASPTESTVLSKLGRILTGSDNR